MANNQFNIKELNYIARQIAHKFPDMPLSPTEIETLLPKDKQSAANEIFQEMKNFGLVNETSSKLDNIALLSVANVMYFNEDNALSPTERTEAQKVATQKLLSQQLQDLNSNEYFIIGGFKLHNDLNHGIVLSPVTGENTLPSPENVLSFLHENKIEVDLIDLTASTEQIEGDLKILDEQPEIQFVELQQHEPLHVMDFLSYSKSIEQQKDIYFYIKGVTDKNEIATRITQMNNIASGDIVLSQERHMFFSKDPIKKFNVKQCH